MLTYDLTDNACCIHLISTLKRQPEEQDNKESYTVHALNIRMAEMLYIGIFCLLARYLRVSMLVKEGSLAHLIISSI